MRQQMAESPPPPPTGATVREWFAGLALMNPVLMHGLTAQERVQEAVRLADELITALAAPRTPSQESLTVPQTEPELRESWNGMARAMNPTSEQQAPTTAERITQPDRPAVRRSTGAYDFSSTPRKTIPPPSIHFKRASDHLARATRTNMPTFSPEAGRYSSLGEPPNDDE